jgi:RNA polymerase sigma-70 factor (ECF subfamily)
MNDIPTSMDTGPSSDLSIQTHHSLLSRLKIGEDQRGWKEFFDRYWRLIYGFARKSGMSDADAQDIVQEVMLSVFKSLPEYQRQAGSSFKGWLLTIVRRRMADHWRARLPKEQKTVPIEDRISSLGQEDAALDKLWQEEWENRLFEAAAQRVQQRMGARNYLIFDLLVRKRTPLRTVCQNLGVNAAQAYLAKHRVGKMMKQEVARLKDGKE